MAHPRTFALFALLMLLFAQPAFSFWSQELNVSVVDMNNMPVKGASVAIAYQKTALGSVLDGAVSGETENDGSFYATLSNTAPFGQENKSYEVRVSAYYWQGSVSRVEAGSTASKNLRVQIPFILETVRVRALPPEYLPAGAQATIYGTSVAEQFSGGAALLRVPSGLKFSGYVVSGDNRKFFSSENSALGSDGQRTISVQIPEGWLPENTAGIPAKRIQVKVTFIEPEGEPYADKQVSYIYRRQPQVVTTDQLGSAEFEGFGGIPINMTISLDEYAYSFSNTFNDSTQATIKIPKLLSIEPLIVAREIENCYRVTANVSDPRKHLPIQISFVSGKGAENAVLTANTDDLGRLFVRQCVAANTTVFVRASNKYESTESSVKLEYVPPASEASSFPQSNQTKLPATGKATGGENNFLWALLVVAIAVIAGAVFFANKQLGAPFGFIMNYLRMIYGSIQKTRRPSSSDILNSREYEERQQAPPQSGIEQSPAQQPAQPARQQPPTQQPAQPTSQPPQPARPQQPAQQQRAQPFSPPLQPTRSQQQPAQQQQTPTTLKPQISLEGKEEKKGLFSFFLPARKSKPEETPEEKPAPPSE